jgi:hypothetical protein
VAEVFKAAERRFVHESQVVLTVSGTSGELFIGKEGGDFSLDRFDIRSDTGVHGPIKFGEINSVEVVDAELRLSMLAMLDEIWQCDGK